MALSLSAHDRQALEGIEEGLAASDPQLAAMLSTFSRLADGEAIPSREQLRADKQNRAARQRPIMQARQVRPSGSNVLRIAMALWVATTIVIAIVVVLVLSRLVCDYAC